MKVEINFPGGSGEVASIDQKKRWIKLSPTKHKDLGWECWWYVKISGITPGEKLSVDVGFTPYATPDRAVFSTDNKTWKQTREGSRWGPRIVYDQKVDAAEVWFAWGPPYVTKDAVDLCQRAQQKCRHARYFELCKSRGGRQVPALHISEPVEKGGERYGIWVQGRQHAWESGSSWVCHGFTEWLVSDDPRAESLRQKTEVVVVPIVAVDNVELGAGGKEQVPHDHNRDWSDKPIFNSVAASMKEIKAQNKAGNFEMFIDVHNASSIARNLYFFIPPRELLGDLGNRNLDRFVATAREEMTGPLVFKGQAFESGPNYDKDRWTNMAKNWVCLNTPEHVVSVTLETPWNTPGANVEGYLAAGEQLGLSIERYLRLSPRKK